MSPYVGMSLSANHLATLVFGLVNMIDVSTSDG
jgi:hypothetical protein